MENYEYGTGENTDTVTTKAWAGEENTNIKKEKKKRRKEKQKKKEDSTDLKGVEIVQKREKNNKTSILRYLNPKNMKEDLARYGYGFSAFDYLKFLALCYAGTIGFCYLLGLHKNYIIMIAAVFTFFLPSIFMLSYRNLYEAKKFEDATAYMEQLLRSFQRRGKILNALQDTLLLFPEGDYMYNCIFQAIDYIQSSVTNGNIYQEAFSIIEKEYGCKRLYKIHDYMIKVEGTGGNFGSAVKILLDDRKMWIDRTRELQTERKNIKVKTTICIALSFLVCVMAAKMLPNDFGTIDHIASQTTTSVVVMLNMLIWYIVQRKMTASLLDESNSYTYKELKRRYDYVFHKDLKKERRKNIVIGLLIVVSAAAVWFLAMKNVYIVGVLVACGLFMASNTKRKYKSSLKIVTKEVEKAFPDWLLSMSLQLQTDNVFISMKKTFSEASWILQEELKKLLDEIEVETNDIVPYINFFKKLYIPDVASAMKILYSMSEFGSDDVSGQINSLVERNALIIDKAERLRAQDALAGTTFYALLPMLTGVLKLLVDLILVVVMLMSQLNGIG